MQWDRVLDDLPQVLIPVQVWTRTLSACDLFCGCIIIAYTNSPDVTSTGYVGRLSDISNQKKSHS